MYTHAIYMYIIQHYTMYYINVNQHTKLHVHVRQLLHSLDMYMYTHQKLTAYWLIISLWTRLPKNFR